MRNFKKILALVLATLMVTAMAVSAIYAAPTAMPDDTSGVPGSGVTITINRDSTFAGSGSEGRDLKWYRVFEAKYAGTSGTSEGGGYNSGTGAPGEVTYDPSGTAVSYTASPAIAAKLGTIDSTTKAWTTNAGNQWFDLTYLPGTGNYSVKWRTGVATTAEEVQKAAQWLLQNSVYEAYGDFESEGATWVTEVGKGYYIIQSVAGDNLIAATTDININEKNSYPPLDKTQKDEDQTTLNDAERKVAVGDKIDYQVKVTIPKTAAVGDKIIVWDKPSNGLTYNNDVTSNTVTGADITQISAHTGESWRYVIYVNAETAKGQEVVFNFSMTVNNDALVDTGKKNESGLRYGRGPGSGTESGTFPYDSIPDEVEYKTYFAGIVKKDGDGDNSGTLLSGVKFMLKEGGAEFKVTKAPGKDYYIYDPSGSSEVVTDASGSIRIRGLDGDKTYTLTETATLDGYNILETPVTLKLNDDSYVITTYTPTSGTAIGGTTYYVKSGTEYVVKAYDSGTELPTSGTYLASTESGSSYDAATDDAWTTVLNLQGTLLPSTGGIGTTIFYIVGGLLAVGAGVVLVSKKRMGKVDD